VKHWLSRIVERAGVPPGSLPPVAVDLPAREAWGLVARGAGIADHRLAELVAAYFRLEVADLAGADPAVRLRVPEALARRHHFFPLRETERYLEVATCDPTDVDAERAVGFTSGRPPLFRVAPPSAIQEAIDSGFTHEADLGDILGSLDDEVEEAVRLIEEAGPESISAEDAGATPVVRLTNLIIREGIQAGASDIHVEPGRSRGIVRFRVDGVLRQHMELPMAAMNRIVSRIKILSRLDIADRLRPQDGKARVRVADLAYDLRVSTIPAAGSEKCVIRILDSNSSFTLEDLDLPARELERFRQLLTYRDGIVLVTGPTGSGKTTTLYGALRELATGRVNIMTVEDPIEYELPAVTQTQVELKQGVTFASALRAILRQDPDVILVGEIRDRETAVTAAQAAMTGHLVLATVHANDAVSSVARLADLGLQFSTIATTLRGALAQRLIRKVCPSCAESIKGELTPEETRLSARYRMRPTLRATGCPECAFVGYRGRLPVQEVLTVGPRMQQAIELRKGFATLQKVAIGSGMRTLAEVALDWVQAGRTTLAEVDRVLGQLMEESDGRRDTGPTRIVVVAPEEEDRRRFSDLLVTEGYEVKEFHDGDQALDLLAEDPDFSLIVGDLTQRRLPAREMVDRVRGSVDTAAIPVLLRGDGVGPSLEEELLESGVDGILPRELTAGLLLARVRALLRRAAL